MPMNYQAPQRQQAPRPMGMAQMSPRPQVRAMAPQMGGNVGGMMGGAMGGGYKPSAPPPMMARSYVVGWARRSNNCWRFIA